MKIVVNIRKSHFLPVIGALLLLTGIFAAYAYNAAWATAPGDPAVMGHTLDEIEGMEDYVRQIVNDEISGIGNVTCNVLLWNSSSTVGTKGGWFKVDVPSVCMQTSGCVIRQEVYNMSNKLLVSRQYQYNQYSNNLWWSSYQTKGTYTNGNTESTKIVPDYSVVEGSNRKYLRVRDDYSHNYGGSIGLYHEVVAAQWSLQDNSNNRYQKIYVCTPVENEDDLAAQNN